MNLNGCISFFFDWENAKLVMLHYCFFSALHFSYCIHVYCAQFLACLIDCFFAFWLCMCIRLFTLFFPIVLCIPSCVLFVEFRWFSISAFCRIFGGATSSFAMSISSFDSFFFASRNLFSFIPGTWCLLCGIDTFFSCFFAQFSACFFAAQISCYASICPCSFCFCLTIIWQLCAIIFLLHYHILPVHP